MKATNQKAQPQRKTFCKNLVADSLRTLFHTLPSLREKSDESQLPIRDSVESKRPPAHAFIGSSVGHFPRTEANHAPIVLFLVDKKVLRGAKNFVDSLVAVFAHIGNTFKRSKNFSDHIFYWLRLEDYDTKVKAPKERSREKTSPSRSETIFAY